jgi:hypothetical protein
MNSTFRYTATAAFLCSLLGIALAVEETPAPTTPPDAAPPAKAFPSKPPAGLKLRYNPPVSPSGAASVRVTGGTRGAGEKQPMLYVLAPEHVALTTQPQPALFWYQSHPAKADFELTLTEPKKAEPLLSLKGDASQKAGIHSVALARHNVTLKPGVTYQWSVAIIPDSANRSKDVIASGMVKRVEAPGDLAGKIGNASAGERAALYAQAGFWYDALQAISTGIAAEPKNGELHEMRAALLEQAKLPEAAAADRH